MCIRDRCSLTMSCVFSHCVLCSLAMSCIIKSCVLSLCCLSLIMSCILSSVSEVPSRVERQRQCDRLWAVSCGSVPAPAQPAQLPVLCHQLHHHSARLHIRLSLSAWVLLVCLHNYVIDWMPHLLCLHPGCGCEWDNSRFVPELIQDQDTEVCLFLIEQC